jgi:protein O-GlcNAc transferase
MNDADTLADDFFRRGDNAHDARDYPLAERLVRSALGLNPAHWQARYTLAVILQDLGRHAEAIPLYESALADQPTHAKALNNYGVALQYSGRREDAIDAFRRATRADPSFLGAVTNLSGLLAETGRADEAIAVLTPLCNPVQPNVFDLRRALIQAPIAASAEQIRLRRAEMLADLRRIAANPPVLQDPLREVGRTPFYLPYQPDDDRELLEVLADVYRQACPSLSYVAPHCATPSTGERRTRRRIGFASMFFYDHSVGRVMHGLIERLPRDRFEVVVIFLGGTPEGPIARSLLESADRTVEAPYYIAAAREMIGALELDALCLPDFGMDPLSYFLGFARLAPMQCTTWGHVETSGLKSIDWFVSTEAWERPDANADYTERLHLLKGVASPSYLTPIPASGGKSQLASGAGSVSFVCFQTLYKLHPDFDLALRSILEALPEARLHLVRSSEPAWNAEIISRLNGTLGATAAQVVWLDPMSRDDYQATLEAADIVLDPFHFSGGNTSLEALAAGTPIVTLEGRLMRARFTAGFYKVMDMEDMIARSAADYIRLAVVLARDADQRNDAVRRIEQRRGCLFEDAQVIGRWTEFLLDATEAARRA